ncbi:MAG: type II toxin-antitoxin system mRNA interferase toxin, RelE/StbE family [Chloroflexi bacterium]|nr:type II toxin-antitoxin system mRNA interferase toxin, RelE/StbE family [Chloroflexota bacterium]
MRKLTWDTSFRRAFKRRTRNNAALQDRIFQVLDRLAEDPFQPALKTHKLSGQLKGLWACWVEYDCRIVFAFEPDPDTEGEMIVLVDLGTHAEVY